MMEVGILNDLKFQINEETKLIKTELEKLDEAQTSEDVEIAKLEKEIKDLDKEIRNSNVNRLPLYGVGISERILLQKTVNFNFVNTLILVPFYRFKRIIRSSHVFI